MMNKGLLYLFLLLIASANCMAQQVLITNESRSTSGQTYKLVHYIFEGDITPQAAAQLDADIQKMQFVVSSKTEVKPEAKRGRLAVKVLIVHPRSEGDPTGFDAVDLKNLLLKYNFTPIDLQETELKEKAD